MTTTDELSKGLHLMRAARQWRLGAQSVLQAYGTTLPQYQLLASIQEITDKTGTLPSQKMAADHADIDINVASQIVKVLVAHHLVNRGAHAKDSRAFVLANTLAGTQLVKASEQALQDYSVRFFM